MAWQQAIGGLLVLGVVAVFAIIFAFYPKRVVRFLAWLGSGPNKQFWQIPDEQLDRHPLAIYDKYGRETFSRLIKRGDEHPEEFPTLIRHIRRFGYIVCFVVLIDLGLFILWAIRIARW